MSNETPSDEKRVLETRIKELEDAIRTHEHRVRVDNIVGTDKALWALAK